MQRAVDPDAFRSLQQEAGVDFVAELVDAFLEDAPAMLDSLRSALAARDEELFRRTAHSLKSNSVTFGADALGALARELEAHSRELVSAGDAAVLVAPAAEYARVAAALRELRGG